MSLSPSANTFYFSLSIRSFMQDCTSNLVGNFSKHLPIPVPLLSFPYCITISSLIRSPIHPVHHFSLYPLKRCIQCMPVQLCVSEFCGVLYFVPDVAVALLLLWSSCRKHMWPWHLKVPLGPQNTPFLSY